MKTDQTHGETLQSRVFHALTSQIANGSPAVGEALPPERRLAESLGVSRITVIKVLDRMERDGWISRERGRGTFVLSRGPTKPLAVAFLAAVPAHPSLFRALMGMAPVINAAGGYLRIMGRFEGLGSLEDMLKRAKSDGTDGYIIYPDATRQAPEVLRALARSGTPMVLVDRSFDDLDVDSVTYNDHKAGHEIGLALAARGVRRIAVLPHRERFVSSVEQRLAGIRSAWQEAGLGADNVRFWPDVYADFSPSNPVPANGDPTAALLRARLEGEPVDGFFAINADVAERLASDIRASGLIEERFPDGVLIGACVHKPLTNSADISFVTTEERADMLGQTAAQLMMERLSGRASGIEGRPRNMKIDMMGIQAA